MALYFMYFTNEQHDMFKHQMSYYNSRKDKESFEIFK